MEDQKSVKIIIAAHKKYRMPEGDMYLPLQVGAFAGDRTGYCGDNTGDQISEKNPQFCELTGLYWAWKNLPADYLGLAHYRRHFTLHKNGGRKGWEAILTREELEPFLGTVRVFTPQKRRYYIESLYSHYQHTHYQEHLDETRRIIERKHPEYVESFDRVMKHRYGYMFNMMIMERSLLDDYCTWLFDILFALEETAQETGLSYYQGRLYGRVAEIIFNVWLDHQLESGEIKPEEVKELGLVHMERVNWIKKGFAFLRAKFFKKKYEHSF